MRGQIKARCENVAVEEGTAKRSPTATVFRGNGEADAIDLDHWCRANGRFAATVARSWTDGETG